MMKAVVIQYGMIKFFLECFKKYLNDIFLYRRQCFICLAGHSGGAQFTLRVLYLYPKCIRAALISAPGRLTLVNGEHKWPLGTSNISVAFPDLIRGMDMNPLKQVSVYLTVGSKDCREENVVAQNDPAQTIFGMSRVQRLDSLEKHLRSLSVNVT